MNVFHLLKYSAKKFCFAKSKASHWNTTQFTKVSKYQSMELIPTIRFSRRMNMLRLINLCNQLITKYEKARIVYIVH